MAGDNHGASSLFRRAEQIRRWKESETNRQEYSDSPRKKAVKFSDECIFLAAAAAGDTDELVQLLQRGADINTVNQDGITALHAACIDNNLSIVEFLVDAGADINRSDMEGWTPLHATASCGSLTMAKFLIDRGSDLSLVNNDGELPVDVVDEPAMATLLAQEMAARGIDGKTARSAEERCMLQDVTQWLHEGCPHDAPHPKTGATALHVAAAKGYTKVMRLLLDAGCNVNAPDLDGWRPLHAAVHWGQTEAVELLCDALADLDALNAVGQTPADLADPSIRPLLDEMRRKHQNRHNRKRKPSPSRESGRRKESSGARDTENGPRDRPTENGAVNSATPLDASEVQSWRRPSSLKGARPSKENNGSPVVGREPLTERSLSTPNNLEDNNSDNNKLVVTPVRRTVSFDRENRDSSTASSPSLNPDHILPIAHQAKPELSDAYDSALVCQFIDGDMEEDELELSMSQSLINVTDDNKPLSNINEKNVGSSVGFSSHGSEANFSQSVSRYDSNLEISNESSRSTPVLKSPLKSSINTPTASHQTQLEKHENEHFAASSASLTRRTLPHIPDSLSSVTPLVGDLDTLATAGLAVADLPASVSSPSSMGKNVGNSVQTVNSSAKTSDGANHTYSLAHGSVSTSVLRNTEDLETLDFDSYPLLEHEQKTSSNPTGIKSSHSHTSNVAMSNYFVDANQNRVTDEEKASAAVLHSPMVLHVDGDQHQDSITNIRVESKRSAEGTDQDTESKFLKRETRPSSKPQCDNEAVSDINSSAHTSSPRNLEPSHLESKFKISDTNSRSDTNMGSDNAHDVIKLKLGLRKSLSSVPDNIKMNSSRSSSCSRSDVFNTSGPAVSVTSPRKNGSLLDADNEPTKPRAWSSISNLSHLRADDLMDEPSHFEPRKPRVQSTRSRFSSQDNPSSVAQTTVPASTADTSVGLKRIRSIHGNPGYYNSWNSNPQSVSSQKTMYGTLPRNAHSHSLLPDLKTSQFEHSSNYSTLPTRTRQARLQRSYKSASTMNEMTPTTVRTIPSTSSSADLAETNYHAGHKTLSCTDLRGASSVGLDETVTLRKRGIGEGERAHYPYRDRPASLYKSSTFDDSQIDIALRRTSGEAQTLHSKPLSVVSSFPSHCSSSTNTLSSSSTYLGADHTTPTVSPSTITPATTSVLFVASSTCNPTTLDTTSATTAQSSFSVINRPTRSLSLKERIARNTRDCVVVGVQPDTNQSSTTTTSPSATTNSPTSPVIPTPTPTTTSFSLINSNSTSSTTTSTSESLPTTYCTTSTSSTLPASVATTSSCTTASAVTTSSATTATVNSTATKTSNSSNVSPNRVLCSNVTIITSAPNAGAKPTNQAPTITAVNTTVKNIDTPPTPPPKQHLSPPTPPASTAAPPTTTSTTTTTSTSSASQMTAALAKMSPSSVIKNFFKCVVVANDNN
ncbi:protein phosphatase 1 regulatory subunit 12A [Hyalella azteca]|uniref:Protein phosphatase 1 regulatory subunit 12A n=1 Tax=Hyalella azteca TaxID=294128 RepID=A0A979FSL6_HYAAZ|nr:protein phosphatase 1 regulatory subunit 12A [Hyalella azteca]